MSLPSPHSATPATPADATLCPIRIGWAEVDLTPPGPVLVAGQFHARISEKVLDPLTATVLALDSGEEAAIFVSCDLSLVSEQLQQRLRSRLEAEGKVPWSRVIVNITHTHTGPVTLLGRYGEKGSDHKGYPLPVEAIGTTLTRTAERIAAAIEEAWEGRAPGSIAFGLGHAVISRNRRWVDTEGKSTMYGNIATKAFSHIEGYEDHDLNVLATYDAEGALNGLLLNTAAPSQVRESMSVLSADFWHETRQELRKRFGAGLHILAQCSPAGDQAPLRMASNLYNFRAEARMLELKSRDACDEIAHRIANAVEELLPWIKPTRESTLLLRHETLTLDLPLNRITQADADEAAAEAARYRALYEEEVARLEADPDLREQPHWFHTVTRYHAWHQRHRKVVERFHRYPTAPTHPIEIHLVRLGEIAWATSPFEYYLDYGIALKARSPAVQTFLVQLCGPGSYLPSRRSLAGGGYGSVPASNIFGPEAGDLLRETTLEHLCRFWEG